MLLTKMKQDIKLMIQNITFGLKHFKSPQLRAWLCKAWSGPP